MIDLGSCTTFFDTFEAREEVFRKTVGFKLARRYGGPALFWKDFRSISQTVSPDRPITRVCSITSNPRDCLAFATARQVLTAALLSAGASSKRERVTAVASQFGLAGLLDQPVRTLSGGESVKLALAKTYVSISSCDNVLISSPFTWLSPANRYLLEAVIEQCRDDGRDISILALAGENDLTPALPALAGNNRDCTFPVVSPFSLQMSAVNIPLTLSLNPLDDAAPYAAVDDTILELESPCLISGENGQGKSLVARAAAGSLAMKGQAVFRRNEKEGRANLLFQDVQTQTLMRSFTELAAGIRGVPTALVLSAYNDVRKNFTASLGSAASNQGKGINAFDSDSHTLLDIKTLLTAVRLAADPPALILDEPDWGLSRSSSIAFVSAVITAAHERKIPVLLISHKPWWQSMISSCLTVSRTVSTTSGDTHEPVFTISLERGS